MKKIGKFICKNKTIILLISLILIIPSFINMQLTKINYNILVYLPDDIETMKGQNILADDFDMGAFSVTVLENMNAKDILKLEDKIRDIPGVAKVISGYDLLGTDIPTSILPTDIQSKLSKDNNDIMLITYEDSTSADTTLDAVAKVREITKGTCKVGGMSAMLLDTMDLAQTEITIYIVIAVVLCILVLELSLNSYLVPILLMLNIGMAILYNLGTNLVFGEISYITKALVAVLQLGVTTDFSIFLYHSYESKKDKYKTKEEAMTEAISETFISVLGSSLTTIAGFLVLCTMKLTLGEDLGLVMAKGVFLGVITTLTVFPVLLLYFDNAIEKTKHKSLLPKFTHLNNFVIKNHKIIFALFIILIIPMYLANSKVGVYYKLDETLPSTLESVSANNELKQKFNIVSPEIILIDKDMKTNDINNMVKEIEDVDGVDFVLSFSSLGIDKNLLSEDMLSIIESDKYQMLFLNSTYDIASNELNDQVNKIQSIITKYDKNGILAGEGPLMKDLVKISDTDFSNVNNSSIICILLIMLFVLKSYTLPILLISVIEFAIFTNMAVPYFSGELLPFVAPIVLGTIQLGATIDYAILMTTTYLANRRNNKEKEDAIKSTMTQVVPSIIVSGLCFFGATFGVGVYSKLEMIGSLCTLISRGALISMAFVILILPSVLLIFDKLIMKTTMKERKEKTKMNKKTKKNIKKVPAFLMLIVTMFYTFPVYALEKDETVYTKLDNTGKVKSTSAVERLSCATGEDIKDLSNLEDILNISGDEKYQKEGNTLTWKATGNDISYSGTINKELPISVKITYYLDGKEKKLEDILGKKGNVTIKLSYENKDSHYINGNRLYTPFVALVGTIIDTGNNKNITITNGKVVNNGVNAIAVALAAPGLSDNLGITSLNTMNDVAINMETTSFELPSIYSVITPKVIESSDLEVFNKLDSLYSSMDLLKSSMDTIEEGARKLYEGTNTLSSATTKIHTNIQSINNTITNIENGSIDTKEGLESLLEEITELRKMLGTDDSEEIKAIISNNQEALGKLLGNIKDIKELYDNYNLANIDNKTIMNLTEDFYQNYGLTLTPDEVFDMNIKLVNTKYAYESTYNDNVLISNIIGNNSEKLEEYLTILENINTKIDAMVDIINQKLTSLGFQVVTMEDVSNHIKENYSILMSKENELYNGVTALNDGSRMLKEGIEKYNNEGIAVLYNYSKQVESMESKLKSLVQLGEEYQTFTMKEDNATGSTKFILIVDGETAKEEVKNTKTNDSKVTFWTKVKDLFK